MSRSKNYCFTINNYKPSDVTAVDTCSCDYICWGYEQCPTTGTPHIQGYVSWSIQRTVGATSKALGGRAHVRAARGSAAENRTYIFGPYEKGDKTKAENPTAVERGDISLAAAADDPLERVIEMSKGGATWQTIVQTFPSLIISKLNGIREIWRQHYVPRVVDSGDVLRPWQQQLLDYIERENTNRVVFWCFNRSGNVGKSFLRRRMFKDGWQTLSPGSFNDLAYQWNCGDVIFDLPRDAGNDIDYSFIEAIKDGMVVSNKYEGGTKVHVEGSARVLVFANKGPKYGTLSKDRFRVIEIVDDKLVFHNDDII